MGLFGNSTQLDPYIDRATSEKNTSDDWACIIDVCDKVKEYSDGPKDCIKSITKKLNSDNPRVALQAVTLLDACISNCGRPFLLEVASRDFENELTKLLTSHRTHSKVSEKLRKCLKNWAEGDFKSDRQLSLIPALYQKLRHDGYDFNVSSDSPKKKAEYSNDPNVVNSKQEEEDIAKAIQLSLQSANDSGGKGKNSTADNFLSNSGNRSLYPMDLARDFERSVNISSPREGAASAPTLPTVEKVLKARALYDFEAAEDNELTFLAGELIVVLDNSDQNWWKGSNHRGEGLFPANFVTLDISSAENHTGRNSEKRVSFSECVKVTEVSGEDDYSSPAAVGTEEEEVPPSGEVDEEKINQLLHFLHETDPTGDRQDDPQLPSLEKEVMSMAPTIDAELEHIDRRHNELSRLNTDLMSALNLYHQMMREVPNMGYYPAVGPTMPYMPPLHHEFAPQQPGGYQQYPTMPGMIPATHMGPPLVPFPQPTMDGIMPPHLMASMMPPPPNPEIPATTTGAMPLAGGPLLPPSVGAAPSTGVVGASPATISALPSGGNGPLPPDTTAIPSQGPVSIYQPVSLPSMTAESSGSNGVVPVYNPATTGTLDRSYPATVYHHHHLPASPAVVSSPQYHHPMAYGINSIHQQQFSAPPPPHAAAAAPPHMFQQPLM